MKRLFYRLIIFINTTENHDTNYNIALFMVHNFYRIGNMRINEVAEECFVSPATVSRFCRALGYENFAHLKQECIDFHSPGKMFDNLIEVSLDTMHDNPTEATKIHVNQIIDYLKDLPDYLDWNEVDAMLELIHDHDTVAFFGTQFSHSVALHFQTDLLMLEKFVMAYTTTARQEECAKGLDENSVAVIFSVNGYFVDAANRVMHYLKKSGCKIVLITCNSHIDTSFKIDHIILLGKDNNKKIGKHSLLTAVELMSLRYYCLYYPSITELKEHLL
ncbi:MAG: MurR/RpiR family transcriptional regulator [Erysipelotrichaceae bacterium]|nr:MurR/RpiR family transcriptional regulator [Erysipelotrichaceae bacterium]